MPIQTIDVGDHVECDWCSRDFTGKPDEGGFLFQSKATCPICALRIEAGARKHGEEHFIRERCPAGTPFAKWVLALRGGNNTIKFLTGDEAEDFMRGGGDRG